MKVFVAAISNEHGVNIYGIYSTENEAINKVYEYVEEWWEDEIGDEFDCTNKDSDFNLSGTNSLVHLMPKENGGTNHEEKRATIDAYFKYCVSTEFYEIKEFNLTV